MQTNRWRSEDKGRQVTPSGEKFARLKIGCRNPSLPSKIQAIRRVSRARLLSLEPRCGSLTKGAVASFLAHATIVPSRRSHSCFYVRYELTAAVSRASQRNEILDRLHGKIQDMFNEQGVQIMSPHFRAQPPHNVVVPKAQWFAAPAKPQERTKG